MGIKFTCSSEFLDNYKIMDLASSENKMTALCDERGNRLLSIGDDKALYLTCEVDKNETGWEKVNLSNGFNTLFKDKTIAIKNFEAIKNENKFIIAVVVTVDNRDNLFISMEEKVEIPLWKAVPFDNPGNTGGNISNIYISSFDKDITIICDVRTDDGLIKRYFIDYNNILNSNIKWVKHSLPTDFEVTNNSCMGRSHKELVDGIYTLGAINKAQQLIYTPVYNAFDPSVMPSPMRFKLPKNVDIIACAAIEDIKKNKYTHLFACGSQSLYIFPYENQTNDAEPIEIAVSEKLEDVYELFAYNINDTIMVWGRNQNRKVFYTFCSKDKVADKNSWSEVLTFMDEVEYVYPFINKTSNSNSILAYGSDKTVIIGQQSPSTNSWSYSNITLPKLDGKALKFTSYTTKITVTDDDGNLMKNKIVSLQAMDYCNVYINGLYYSLKEDPIDVETNEYGVIKIIYKTNSPISKNFKISAQDSEETVIAPWEKTIDKLLELRDTDKLKNAVIVDRNGNKKPLVDKDVSDEALQAVANSLSVLSRSKESLTSNNSNAAKDVNALKVSNANSMENANANREESASIDSTVTTTQLIKTEEFLNNAKDPAIKNSSDVHGVTICISNNNIQSYTGSDALEKAHSLNLLSLNSGGAVALNENCLMAVNNSTLVGGVFDDIIYTAEDIFNFLKDSAEKVYNIAIHYVEEAWNFILDIGGKIYSFVIDCADKLVGCIQAVFNYIKVGIEKIVDFLKFMFDWDDVLKTKDVSKKLFNLGLDKLGESANGIKDTVQDFIDEITKNIDAWANITHIDEFGDKTINQISKENNKADTSSVTNSFLLDHFTDNCGNMEIKSDTQDNNVNVSEAKPDIQINDAMTPEAKANAIANSVALKSNDDYLASLSDYATTQGKILEDVIKQINAEFIDNDITKLDFLTIVKKIAAIVSDAALYSIENGVDLLIDLFSTAIEIIKKVLNYEIRIPVLSDILEDLFGIHPFSILDVMCFVASALANLTYKLITQKKLFDDATYNSIMNSESIEDLFGENKNANLIACASFMENDTINEASVANQVNGLPTTETRKTVSAICHILCGAVTIIEAAVKIPAMAEEGEFGKMQLIDSGLILALTVFGFSAGLCYQPYKTSWAYFSVTVVAEYIPIAGGIANSIVSIWPRFKSSLLASKTLKNVFQIWHGIGCIVNVIVDILYMFDVCKNENSDEKEVGIIEITSNMLNDIAGALDIIMKYINDPDTRLGFLIVREILVSGYGGLHIAEGILIDGYEATEK